MRKTIFAAGIAAAFTAFAFIPWAGAARVGIEASDHACRSQFGGSSFTTGGWSSWASDTNGYNPDCYAIDLDGVKADEDFRIGVQMSDQDGCSWNPGKAGAERFTPWASEGGGWSGWVSQAKGFDPDCARVFIETKPMTGAKLLKARAGIQVADLTCTAEFGGTQNTPWASPGAQTGGWSDWAVDTNAFDPDCIQVGLESEVERTGNVSVHVTADNGAAIKATWTVKDGKGNTVGGIARPGQSGLYSNLPFGLYSIEAAPAAVDDKGDSYTFIEVKPGNPQNLGPASPPACANSNEANPHNGCQNGQCVLVYSCGSSDCSACPGGSGGPGPEGPLQSVWKALKEFFSLRFLNVARASIDFDRALNPDQDLIFDPSSGMSRPHYACVQNACQQVDTVGTDSCGSNADCGGPSEPPPPPPDTGVAPNPTAIDFELRYKAPPSIPPGPDGAYSQPTCLPGTSTTTIGSQATFLTRGGGTYTWTATGSNNPSQVSTTDTFTTSWNTTGDYEVQVANGIKPDAFCKVTVLQGPKPPRECHTPPKIVVKSNYPITWDISGPSEQHQTAPSQGQTYDPVENGTYTFVPQPVGGLTYTYASDSLGPIQSIGCGQTANFHIVYAPDPGSPQLACLANPASVRVNENASFSAWNGDGSYSWTASANANPASYDGGSAFYTKFSKVGTEWVTVTSKLQSASCMVQVTSVCPGNPTLNIVPPSADIFVGDTAVYNAIYDADGPNCSGGGENMTNYAGWSVADRTVGQVGEPGRVTGLKSGSTDVFADYQGLRASARLNVTGRDKDFRCTVSPNSIVVTQGDSIAGTVSCEPVNYTGPISLAPAGLPAAADITFAPQSKDVPPNADYQYRFFAGLNTPTGAWTTYVHATGLDGIAHDSPLYVTVNPRVANLSVSLTADPDAGAQKVSSNLIARVDGSATGPINYYFWWNCGYSGSSLTVAKAQCSGGQNPAGGTGATITGTLSNPQSIVHEYAPEGTYSALVIVERDQDSQGHKYAASGSASVTVTRPDPFCTPATQNASIGQLVTLTGQGTAPLIWSADGSPSTGTGEIFQTSFSSAGTHTVTVSNLLNGQISQSQCKVEIGPNCSPSLTITPSSATVQKAQTQAFTGTYDPDGNCSQTPQTIQAAAGAQWSSSHPQVASVDQSGRATGLNVGHTVIELDYKGLQATASLNVEGDWSCAVSPDRIALNIGERASGSVTCTWKNGYSKSISFSPAEVPPGSSLKFTPSQVSPGNSSQYSFTTSDATPTGAYTMFVAATSQGEQQFYAIEVNISDAKHAECVNGTCTLVNGSGSNSCAPIGGSCTGETACIAGNCLNFSGGSGCGNGCSTPETHIGCDRAIVNGEPVYRCIIKDGGGPNTDGCVNTGTNCTPYHFECVGAACVQVQGAGPDRCTAGDSCIRVNHGECVAGRCKNVAGTLPPGKKGCNDDAQCGPPPGCEQTNSCSHLACGAGACIIVSGGGTNENGCTSVGQKCSCTDPSCPKQPGCKLTASPALIKKGESAKLSWTCDPGVVECAVLDTRISGGRTGQGTVSPAQSTKYTLSCDDGFYTANATVNVGCIREIGPNGQPTGECK